MKTLKPLVFVLSLFCSSAFAVEFKSVTNLGYDGGGDSILKVRYTNGDTSTLSAGKGLLFSTGLGIRDLFSNPDSFTMDLQAMIGVKFDSIDRASNASATFVRFPVEALVFGRYDWLRVGVGPTYHFGNSYSGSGLTAGQGSFDSSLGLISEMDFFLSERFSLGLRYGRITYNFAGNDLSGESYGLHLSLLLF